MDERAYLDGQRALAMSILHALLPHLGGAKDAEAWRLERAEVVAQLRNLCADFGDNDWTDDMHLGDVIEKHLGRALYSSEAP